MVVTNLRFANSPAPVGGDELTLDNPEVQGLFASSPDSTRSGPIVVAPGEESSISPPMDAGILDPVSGGRTVLMAGEVEDSSGTPTPFVVEYIADEPTPTPSSSAWSIFALLIVAIAMIFSGRRFKARLERTGKISP
ncbi:MAG: hypothetical protein Q8L35_07075 [Actinomycetota bacterium]|nr:hypothetical protein [Actinomycetota bacterium]